MKSQQKIVLKFVSGIITLCFLYELVSTVFILDFLTSLVPGWHTTMYSSSDALRITFFIAIASVITSLLFLLMYRLLTYLWLKISAARP
jgi:hypothetical protein